VNTALRVARAIAAPIQRAPAAWQIAGFFHGCATQCSASQIGLSAGQFALSAHSTQNPAKQASLPRGCSALQSELEVQSTHTCRDAQIGCTVPTQSVSDWQDFSHRKKYGSHVCPTLQLLSRGWHSTQKPFWKLQNGVSK
jgi:hypothetical protein